MNDVAVAEAMQKLHDPYLECESERAMMVTPMVSLTELGVAERKLFERPLTPTPMELLSRAMERGTDVVMLEKLLNLQQQWEANNAKKAFDAAIAAARAELPVIKKNRKAKFEHKTGDGTTEYMWADLAAIAETIDPILGRHGLSYRFRTKTDVNQPVVVTCIVSHSGGHFEETVLCAGRDESGKKNSIQSLGSTVTYLQRYTLRAALGLAAAEDDDGKASGQTVQEKLSDQQLTEMRVKIESTGTNVKHFCDALSKIANVSLSDIVDIPVAYYDRAMQLLAMKEAKQKAK